MCFSHVCEQCPYFSFCLSTGTSNYNVAPETVARKKMKKLSSRSKSEYEKLRTSQTLIVASSFTLKVSTFFPHHSFSCYNVINYDQHAYTITVFFFFLLIGARSLSLIPRLHIPSKGCVCLCVFRARLES